MVDISKLTIPLTRDEVKMLWLDLDKEQINKRIGEQGKNQ